jgi:hypothetical protein
METRTILQNYTVYTLKPCSAVGTINAMLTSISFKLLAKGEVVPVLN